MSFRLSLFPAILAWTAVFIGFAQPALSQKTEPAWAIKQTSYNLGDLDITLAKDGMRWHSDKVGLTILMRAPDWKLNAFNETNKKYLVLDKDEALEVFQHQRRRDKSGIEAPIRTDKFMTIAGQNAICYCYAHGKGGVSSSFAVDVTKGLEKGEKMNAAQRKYIANVTSHERREYWLSKDIAVSPKISAMIMERVASTKYGDSLPLRLVQIGRDGVRTMMFDTAQVKKVAVSPDIFKLPQGYTKAENKIALLVNDSEFGSDADLDFSSSKTQPRKHEEVHR